MTFLVTEEATETAPWDVNKSTKSFLMHRMLPEMQNTKPAKGCVDDMFQFLFFRKISLFKSGSNRPPPLNDNQQLGNSGIVTMMMA